MTRPVFELPASGDAYVQVTATAEWDKAAKLASADDAEAYLAGPDGVPAGLAVELLWEGPPIVFVGCVLRGARVVDLPAVVQDLLSAPGPEAALTIMTDDLGTVTGAELGAINAWTLVPPLTIWDGQTWHEASPLLEARPDLRSCRYPVGLEVGHQRAYYAVEVSVHDGDHHVVDPNRLADLCRQLRQPTGA